MVAPITGPFSRTTTLLGPPNRYGFAPEWLNWTQTWFRQSRPYNLPLGYSSVKKMVLSSGSSDSSWATGTNHCPGYNGDSTAQAVNKAYAKFVDSFGEKSQWAVTLYEQKQTVAMLAKPLSTLLKFTKQVKRGNFAGAAKTLKTQVPKGLKNSAKAFGNNWLKYHFGIEPLVKDIHNSVETMCKAFDIVKIKGSGTHRAKGGTSFSIRYAISGGDELHSGGESYNVETSVSIRAGFQIENPNLFLASQMGFVNPLSFAWEIIPFSFIVDWFANVGQILSSMSDFAGVTLVNPTTSIKQVAIYTLSSNYYDRVWTYVYVGPGIPDYYKLNEYYANYSRATKSVFFTRSLGVSGPTLKIPAFKGFSVTRGATAVALLIQQLK